LDHLEFRCFPLFFPEIYSERAIELRRNPAAAGGLTRKKTANARCFSLFVAVFVPKKQRQW
jgi:hypothetical protein